MEVKGHVSETQNAGLPEIHPTSFQLPLQPICPDAAKQICLCKESSNGPGDAGVHLELHA